jgi:hypothetical protein
MKNIIISESFASSRFLAKKTITYNLRKRRKLESYVPLSIQQPSVSLVAPHTRKPSSKPLNNIQTLIYESNLLKIPLEEIILLDKPSSDFCDLVTLWLIKKHINALNNKEHFGLRHFFELPLNRNIDYLYSKKIPPELLNKYLLSDIIIYLWRHNISVNKNYELVNKNGNIVE